MLNLVNLNMESPWDETYVSIDLEMTGLNVESDDIIEIGAVKLRSGKVVDRLQTLVNPYRTVPDFIKRLTGISQEEVDQAPPFAVIAGEVAQFVGVSPIVGHNVGFDMAFLARRGLQFVGHTYDTWDLAVVFRPSLLDYSLQRLASSLGVDHSKPHRALEDAEAAGLVFYSLLKEAMALDPAVLSQLARLAARSPWNLRHLFARLDGDWNQSGSPRPSDIGPLGVNLNSLDKRLGHIRPLSIRDLPDKVDQPSMGDLLSETGPFARSFPGFERRPQQLEMLDAVVNAMNERHHLVVEAGTGVGKTLGYLLPAIAYALNNNTRVVISTNTINLQEQLLRKDIPDILGVLKDSSETQWDGLKAVQLKGRANYLCIRRWTNLSSADNLSTDQARALSRVLVWLQDTSTGDRGELNLHFRDQPVWDSICAQASGECLGRSGPCFLRHAREQAEGAHIVVVNHALLLSDLVMGGGVIPSYDTLIVDEAHHLEDEATRHFGYQFSQDSLEQLLENLGPLVLSSISMLRPTVPFHRQMEVFKQAVSELDGIRPRAREKWSRMCIQTLRFLREHKEDGNESNEQLRVTTSTRAQPDWSRLEVTWEDLDLTLRDISNRVNGLTRAIDDQGADAFLDQETLISELNGWRETLELTLQRLKTFMAHPDGDTIYWLAQWGSGTLTFNAAPLHVGSLMGELLFSRKGSVILTGATLSTSGSFHYFRDRVGLTEGEEVLVGSPFDYPNAAQLILTPDVPEPDSPGYQKAAHQAILELAKATMGHILVLFTSNAALRATRLGIKEDLESMDIQVLGQGIDGSPRQMVQAFGKNPRTVLLGTNSFWEGVDLPAGLLKALVVMRIPFNVPTDPVFAARYQLFEDPFNQYAVPQAVLRFRQGFGRLIRRQGDIGTVLVLDGRIRTRGYGAVFLGSIPPCTIKTMSLRSLASEVKDWMNRE